MNMKGHLIVGFVTLIAWFGFYIIGMPSNYFKEWTIAEQTLLSLVTCFAIAPFIAFCLIVFINQNYMKTGIWLAFYSSIPFAIYDLIISGIINGGGIQIYITHWYLSIGYIYVWIIGPLVAKLLLVMKDNWNNTKI